MDLTGINSTQKLSSLLEVNGQIKNAKSLKNDFISFTPRGQKQDPAFEKALEQSKLDDRIPNRASLAKQGFEKESIIDMNGGNYYKNSNGDTIRVSKDGVLAGKRAPLVEYKSADGRINHSIVYDQDGNPFSGEMKVKQNDGSVVTYNYEYDIEGNKKLLSKNVEYPKDTSSGEIDWTDVKPTDAIIINRPVNVKKLTASDLELIKNESSGTKVMNHVLNNSPIGKTAPNAETLRADGYMPEYRTDENGAGYYGPVRVCSKEGEEALGQKGATRATYTNGNLIQDMYYDKDGNMKQGSITVLDKYGNVDRKILFTVDENGKMTVVQ